MTSNRLVTIVAFLLVLCSVTVIAGYFARVGFNKVIPQGVRFALTCLLGYSLIKGWKPAWWIAVILMSLSGVVSVLVGIGLVMRSPSGVMLIALGMIYLGCAATLLTPIARAHFVSRPPIQS